MVSKTASGHKIASLCFWDRYLPIVRQVTQTRRLTMCWEKGKEISMRKMREVIRLGLKSGFSAREIARSCGISHPTAKKYLNGAIKAGISHEDAEKMDDNALYNLLNSGKTSKPETQRPMPDLAEMHNELKKKHVTMQLLWEEYRVGNPNGYGITQFREYYGNWKKKLDISLRQDYKAGEKTFVDYAGDTVPIYDKNTSVVKQAQIFVAVLGASNYTYSEGQEDQSLPNWINAHVNMFEYFGGVTEMVIPDNLKSGVSNACRYEPDINPTYHDLARHYGTVVIPARVRHPKDKSKVECGVLVVERWILAVLRNRKFFSINELNAAIKELLIKLNNRPFKKLPGSRYSHYIETEKQALKPLPSEPYVLSEWKKARVNIDYHVELKGHYYSVPYTFLHEEADIRHTTKTVEIFHKGNRIASHVKSNKKGSHTTVMEHMPKAHQEYLGWTPSRIVEWAKKTGIKTAELTQAVLAAREHPAQGYRSCLGILRLGKTHPAERIEAACSRALACRAYSYKSVKSILENGIDKISPTESKCSILVNHENIRGNEYFSNTASETAKQLAENKKEAVLC